MRMIFALPMLALAACQVTTDDKNDQMTVEYNQDVAENGVADAANDGRGVAGDDRQRRPGDRRQGREQGRRCRRRQVDVDDQRELAFRGSPGALLVALPSRGVAQPGSASALGAEGRRFESCLPDHA